MIHPDRLAEIRASATGAAWRLSPQARNALAAMALSLVFVESETLASAEYGRRCHDVLYELAPTLATELRRLLDFGATVDIQ